MKLRLTHILLLSLLISLAGCVTSRVEQLRQSNTGMAADEALVILGRANYSEFETEESFTDCIVSALSRGSNPLNLVSEDDFKDQLYPWFEARTAPTSADDLARLFAQPGVSDQIENTKIRYLAWIDGQTVTTDQGGGITCTISAAGGGCFGMSYWEEDASYEASIWDLKTLSNAGQIVADANGTSYLAGLVIPIPILARPGNAACKALAAQLKIFLLDTPE
ncbi:MAG: hypothetical protein QGD92_13955 [Gammaproteobacteria bacterium]|nr:hypothetical protein [Gammaproteobacteria bacterium]